MLDFSLFDTRITNTIHRDTRNPVCAECLETPVRSHPAPMQSGVFHVPSAKFYENGCIYVVALVGRSASCSCPHGASRRRGEGARCWHVGSARQLRGFQMSEERAPYTVRPYVVTWQTEWELFDGDEVVAHGVDPQTGEILDDQAIPTPEPQNEPVVPATPRKSAVSLESLYEYQVAS